MGAAASPVLNCIEHLSEFTNVKLYEDTVLEGEGCNVELKYKRSPVLDSDKVRTQFDVNILKNEGFSVYQELTHNSTLRKITHLGCSVGADNSSVMIEYYYKKLWHDRNDYKVTMELIRQEDGSVKVKTFSKVLNWFHDENIKTGECVVPNI